jgi:hypothetical protein
MMSKKSYFVEFSSVMDGVYRDLTWLRPRTRPLWVWGLVSIACELKKLDVMQRRMMYM